MGFLGRAWKGREPLWKVFWLAYAPVPAGLIVMYIGAGPSVIEAMTLPPFVFIVQGVCILHGIWACVATWRCAPNSNRTMDKTVVSIWVVNKTLARTWIVIYGVVILGWSAFWPLIILLFLIFPELVGPQLRP